MNTAPNPQERVIITSLDRIRTRLWLTRLLERCAIALAFGGGVSICLMAARWVHDRYVPVAVGIALVPVLVAIGFLVVAARRSYRGGFAHRLRRAWGDLPVTVRTFMVIGAALSIAAATLLALPFGAYVAMWMIPATIGVVFFSVALLMSRSISHRAAAIFVDQRAGLKEKVSTALEWANVKASSGIEEGFRAPLMQSAMQACQTVRIARAGYARLDQRVYAVSVVTIAGALAMLMLQPLEAASVAGNRTTVAASKASQTLEDALAQLEKQKKDTNQVAEKTVLEPLRQVADTLRESDDNMSRLDKEMRIAEQEKQFKDMQDRQDADDNTKKEMSKDEELGNLAKAAEEMRQAEAANGNGQGSQESGQAQAMKDIQQAAADAGQKLASGQMTQEDKDKLKASLEKAAGMAGKDPQLQSALKAAADAVDKNDAKGLQQNMTAAGARMGEGSGQKSMNQSELASATKALDRAAQEMASGGGSRAEQAAAQQSGGSGQQGSQQNGGDNGGSQSAQNGGQNGGGQNGEQQGGQDGSQQGGQQSAQGGQQGENGQQGGQQGENQSGQQGAQASSGGQQGSQGSQAGQSGQSGAAGQQTASADTGQNGSTNMKQNGAPGSHNNGNTVNGTGTFVKVYAEKPIANAGSIEKPIGKINPGGAVGTVDVQGAADKADGTLIDYSKEMPAAKQAAESAISKDKIPPQYRDFIHDYFDDKK